MHRSHILIGIILSLSLPLIGPTNGRVRAANQAPLDPIPRGCLTGPAPQFIPALQMSAVGSTPIWTARFRPDLSLHVPMDVGLVPTPHGWPVKIPWMERRSYEGIVTIRAWFGPERRQAWFASHTQGPRPYLRLDPRHPTLYPLLSDPRHPGRALPNPSWKGFSSLIYIPQAACYVMEASWPGGTWRLYFTAGQ